MRSNADLVYALEPLPCVLHERVGAMPAMRLVEEGSRRCECLRNEVNGIADRCIAQEKRGNQERRIKRSPIGGAKRCGEARVNPDTSMACGKVEFDDQVDGRAQGGDCRTVFGGPQRPCGIVVAKVQEARLGCDTRKAVQERGVVKVGLWCCHSSLALCSGDCGCWQIRREATYATGSDRDRRGQNAVQEVSDPRSRVWKRLACMRRPVRIRTSGDQEPVLQSECNECVTLVWRVLGVVRFDPV